LRALAQATDVSPAAPYSHFEDKDDLLGAVAEAGFQKLALQMAEDATGYKYARTRVEKLLTSYIRFALSNKPLFRLMWQSDMAARPTLGMTAGKSYALLSSVLAQHQDAPFLPVALWSMCHGMTTLLIDGKISLEQFGADNVEDFVRKMMGLFKEQV
jgi:AcrR family transcriptional regulator